MVLSFSMEAPGSGAKFFASSEYIRAVARCQLLESSAMVNVTLLSDRAVFEVEGLHQLWALRSRLEIPLTHITDAERDPDQVGRWWHGWKLVGTDVPGLFAAGTFYY